MIDSRVLGPVRTAECMAEEMGDEEASRAWAWQSLILPQLSKHGTNHNT